MKELMKKIHLPTIKIFVDFADARRARKEAEALRKELSETRDRVIAFAGQLDAWRDHICADEVRKEILLGPVNAPDFYRQQEELAALRDRYATFEELAPPDVPRKKFVEMCFSAWEKSCELDREAEELRKKICDLHFHYAGMAGLLCTASVEVSEETRECIEAALADWCKLNPGWRTKKVLSRYSLIPPEC